MTARPTVRWSAERIDGDTYVKLIDVLGWLRNCQHAWDGCCLDTPSRVAAYLADDIRDAWLELDSRMIGGE
jgi:hypothetical protein